MPVFRKSVVLIGFGPALIEPLLTEAVARLSLYSESVVLNSFNSALIELISKKTVARLYHI